MRYRTCLGIVMLLSLGVVFRCHSMAYASEFLKLYDDEGGSTYLDLSSIEDRGEYLVVSTKCILAGEELNKLKKTFGQKLTCGVILLALDKKERKMQRLGGGFYDSEGTPLYTAKQELYSKDKLVEITNGTGAYLIWNIAMKQSTGRQASD